MTANLPSKIVQIPAPTPCVTQSMSPEECAAHRCRISFEVKAFLVGSYWNDRLDPAIETAILADWADELEDWPVDQIRWALREHRRNNPSRKPNPAHILAVLKDRRGRAAAERIARLPRPVEPERPAVDPETRARQQEEIQRLLGCFGKGGAA